MASKNINVLLSLVDRFTSPIQKVAASTKQAERQMKSAHNLVSNFGAGANKRFLSLAGGVASFAAKIATLGGLLSVGGLVAYGNACIISIHAPQSGCDSSKTTKHRACISNQEIAKLLLLK